MEIEHESRVAASKPCSLFIFIVYIVIGSVYLHREAAYLALHSLLDFSASESPSASIVSLPKAAL